MGVRIFLIEEVKRRGTSKMKESVRKASIINQRSHYYRGFKETFHISTIAVTVFDEITENA